MGNSTSKYAAMPKDAGTTADSIEKYYDAIARHRVACVDADEKEALLQHNHNNYEGSDEMRATGAHSKIMRNARVASEDRVAIATHFNAALRALETQEEPAFGRAINSVMELGVDINRIACAALAWVKKHPWETAAIVVPLVILACTPAILGAIGFTACRIAAGKSSANEASFPLLILQAGSLAAAIQASIGSVAASSAFAVLTSAAMGGFGVATVFGLAWGIPAAVLGGIAVWRRWRGGSNEDSDDANDNEGDDGTTGSHDCVVIQGGENSGDGGKVKE